MHKKRRSTTANNKIYIVSAGVFLLFAVMSIYTVWFNLLNKEEFFNNSYNSRQDILAEQYIRGSIYSADGELLAYTEVGEDGTEERVYPYGELFCHTVGYAARGKAGIEAFANYELSHSSATLNDKVSSNLAEEKIEADSVYITLRSDLQEVAYNALGVYNGAIIVTEVKTGNVLAMVSKPDYDPNEIEEFLDSLTETSTSSILVNRATQGLYPPGSIFKLVTTLEYLREHDNDLSGYSYTCNGSFSYGDVRVTCFNSQAHGYEDYEYSLTNSCNSSFANIGVSLDLESYTKTLNGLLFNEELPIDIPSNISSFDLYGDDDSKEAIIQSSFGQGRTIVTPLHMNMITCAIANGGVVMKPQLVSKVVNKDGTTVKTFNAVSYKRLMTAEESDILTDLMEKVVDHGTATKLKGLSYSVAGKTGSAEYDSSKTFSHAWFTGFAPAEDPEIAVTVIMEEAGTGSSYAVPAAKRVMDAYFGVD